MYSKSILTIVLKLHYKTKKIVTYWLNDEQSNDIYGLLFEV